MSITHIKSASRSQGFPSAIRNAIGNFCGRIVRNISGAWNALTKFVIEILQKIFSKTEPMKPQPSTQSKAALVVSSFSSEQKASQSQALSKLAKLPRMSMLGPFNFICLPPDIQAVIMGFCDLGEKFNLELTAKFIYKISCDNSFILWQTFIENHRLPIELTKDAQKEVFKTSAELKNEAVVLQFQLTDEEKEALGGFDASRGERVTLRFQFLEACRAMVEGNSTYYGTTERAQKHLKNALFSDTRLQLYIEESKRYNLHEFANTLEAMQNRLKIALKSLS